MSHGIISKTPDSIQWQDYRAANTGMVVFYSSDPVSEIPIREIPDDIDSPELPDPNYETGTYGYYGCMRTKIRGAFAKSKLRYLFFLTKYAGAKEGFKDKMLVTGYFRIAKTADVQKLHRRYLDEYSCLDSDTCIALRADEVHFVSIGDAFEVSPDQLKAWGFNAKVSKQLRIILSAENTASLLDLLKSKPDQRAAYVAETKRLSPHDEEEVLEDDEAELAGGETVLEKASTVEIEMPQASQTQDTTADETVIVVQEGAQPAEQPRQEAVTEASPVEENPMEKTAPPPQQEAAPGQEPAPQ
ncbi:MAG TPA: hypothetical protein VLX68_10375 [Chitinivibrionales bacterium]|nr:hypothetical protein [Chitinivibrionales bacterium]